MYQIAICDDDSEFRETFQKQVQAIFAQAEGREEALLL